ncbi:MAG: hypothetical protein ABSC45_11205 [Desulfobaccales bacterium]|jgi:hemerythrin-like domain-containing protein
MDGINDPIGMLNEIARDLWHCGQFTIGSNEKEAEQAQSMYFTLERVYLEPIRRSQVQEDTQKYAAITQNVANDTKEVQASINEINAIVDTMKKIDEYAKIFDSIIGLAAGILAMV